MARKLTRSEKIRATKLERAAKYLKASGVTKYGFRARPDGVVVRVPEEIAIVREIDQMRNRGLSYREIADTLNERHVAPPGKGEKWYAATVRRILEDDYYRPRPIPQGLDEFDAIRATHVVTVTGVLGPKK